MGGGRGVEQKSLQYNGGKIQGEEVWGGGGKTKLKKGKKWGYGYFSFLWVD
jgi:hypothetical protein